MPRAYRFGGFQSWKPQTLLVDGGNHDAWISRTPIPQTQPMCLG